MYSLESGFEDGRAVSRVDQRKVQTKLKMKFYWDRLRMGTECDQSEERIPNSNRTEALKRQEADPEMQEFRVVRCLECQVFQVNMVKKAKKWQCKVCDAKQAVKNVHFSSNSGKFTLRTLKTIF